MMVSVRNRRLPRMDRADPAANLPVRVVLRDDHGQKPVHPGGLPLQPGDIFASISDIRVVYIIIEKVRETTTGHMAH